MNQHPESGEIFYPIEDPIFVIRDGKKWGPFSTEALLDKLESGEFSYDDDCLREGGFECEKLRDLLDWDRDVDRPVARASAEEEAWMQEPQHSVYSEPVEEERSVSPHTLLYRGSPSLVAFPWPFFGMLAGIAGGFWLNIYGYWFTIAAFFVSLVCLCYVLLERAMRQYTITGRRVEVVTGLLAKSSKEALISDVRAINVVRKGIPGILGVGTVEFNTTGDEPEVVFQDVWAAKDVKGLVRKIQDSDG